MTTFIGEYSCKLDAKGRFVFPAALKKQIPAAAQERFVVKKDIFENCLVLYTWDEWQRQNEIIRAKLNPYNKTHNNFIRGFYRGTAELELDASGRLLIPKRLFDEVGAEREIYLAGQDSRIELWSKEAYEQFDQDEENFAKLAESILGNQNLMGE